MYPFSTDDKEAESEASEKRNIVSALKHDSQSSAVLKLTSGKEDKSETLDANRSKMTSKTNNSTVDSSCQQSAANSPERTSTTTNRIPKPEFSFREATSSAISDTNNQSDTSVSFIDTEIEIKQENVSDSPGTQLDPHAVSKIQVSYIEFEQIHDLETNHTCERRGGGGNAGSFFIPV